MISTTVQGILAGFVPEEHILIQEPLSRHTTFQVGGEADCVILIETEEELSALNRYLNQIGLPYFVLGNGSNLLVSDQGFHGIVLKTKGNFEKISTNGNKITAQAGALLSQIAKEACEQGLSGMEFAAGIPGTAGGAVIMNAGAYGSELKDVLTWVRVLDTEGKILTLEAGELELGYRTSRIPSEGYVVLEAGFKLAAGDREALSGTG